MKQLFILLFISYFSYPFKSFAQADITSSEMEQLAEKLSSTLNRKCDGLQIYINDFTDLSDEPTELGIYLADLMNQLMVNYSETFELTDRAALRAQGNSGGSNLFEKIADVAIDVSDEHLDTGTDLKKAAKIAIRNSPTFIKKGTKDRRLKDTDVIVYGTITNMGDTYRLTLTASNKKKSTLVANATGDISVTTTLAKLDGNTVDNPMESGSSSDYPSKSGSTMTSIGGAPDDGSFQRIVFQKHPLIFESLGCKSSNRYLECKVRISTSVKDTEVRLYKKNQTKIIDQSDGREFYATEIIFGDQASGSRSDVRKGLVEGIPVEAVFRFEPGTNISVIGRFNIQYSDSVNGGMLADLNNIFVD